MCAFLSLRLFSLCFVMMRYIVFLKRFTISLNYSMSNNHIYCDVDYSIQPFQKDGFSNIQVTLGNLYYIHGLVFKLYFLLLYIDVLYINPLNELANYTVHIDMLRIYYNDNYSH
jgi:hypothetical protein